MSRTFRSRSDRSTFLAQPRLIAHVQGELTLRMVEVPEEPPEFDAKTLAAMRTQAAMSQAVFAKLLNVSTKTLQSWKQGVRQPSDVSRRLIQVFREELGMLCRIVGLPEVTLKQDHAKPAKSRHRKLVARSVVRKTNGD